jgi:hypothetical protein
MMKNVEISFVYHCGKLTILVKTPEDGELHRYETTDMEGFTKALVSNGGGATCKATFKPME